MLASLSITPAAPSVLIGNTQQFTASGIMTDGTAATLGTLTWASGNTSLVTVNSAGLATGLAVGSATITAASGGVTGSATLTVTNIPPLTIEIEPNNNTSQANQLTQGAALTGQLSSSTDEDWYSVTATGAGSVSVAFSATD
ncbi:MAG: Ig-like domain-containing protein, partial [Gallionella sp.]|nr:Ig-like domain-containing protein [Gallionella sp.]